MGHIFTEVIFRGAKGEAKLKALIDTGATYAILPQDLADKLGALKLPRKFKLKLADGSQVETEAGIISIEVKQREVPVTTVIMPDSEPLLGIEALEALGLKPNPETGELEPTRMYTIRA